MTGPAGRSPARRGSPTAGRARRRRPPPAPPGARPPAPRTWPRLRAPPREPREQERGLLFFCLENVWPLLIFSIFSVFSSSHLLFPDILPPLPGPHPSWHLPVTWQAWRKAPKKTSALAAGLPFSSASTSATVSRSASFSSSRSTTVSAADAGLPGRMRLFDPKQQVIIQKAT